MAVLGLGEQALCVPSSMIRLRWLEIAEIVSIPTCPEVSTRKSRSLLGYDRLRAAGRELEAAEFPALIGGLRHAPAASLHTKATCRCSFSGRRADSTKTIQERLARSGDRAYRGKW